MGPIWGRQDPGGPHVGPMKCVIWDGYPSQKVAHAHSNMAPSIIWNQMLPYQQQWWISDVSWRLKMSGRSHKTVFYLKNVILYSSLLFVIFLESAPYVHCQNCALDYLIHSFEQKDILWQFHCTSLCYFILCLCALSKGNKDQSTNHSFNHSYNVIHSQNS